MRQNNLLPFVIGIAVVGAVAGAAYYTSERWIGWFVPPQAVDTASDEPRPAAEEPRLLKLSEQGRKNLGLVSKPVSLQAYWRTIQVPGLIVDRPGVSDRGVSAAASGIVNRIHVFPGDTVKPGDRLFTMRLNSESMQSAQGELFKSTHEIQITLDQKKLLVDSGADKINPARVQELDIQLRRLSVAVLAYRQDLLARGLSSAHLAKVVEGKFISEIEVVAPEQGESDRQLVSVQPGAIPPIAGAATAPVYEVQELKVDLGQQVQAGQTLCILANHQSLYIEGHSFKREAPFLERAAQNGWLVHVGFAEDDDSTWPPLKQTFAIRHLANTIDPVSRSFDFFIPLNNQSRSYVKDGATFLVWRFRPGQRVRLQIPVEEFKDVIVLPTAAITREGPEVYVFRQNGDLFERRAVHVLYEDRLNVVLANDGVIRPEIDYLAQGAAASLNRILKAQNAAGGLPPGAHFHADGSLHIPGK